MIRFVCGSVVRRVLERSKKEKEMCKVFVSAIREAKSPF